jgi:hypothetical protein
MQSNIDSACDYREVSDDSPENRARWRGVTDLLLEAAEEAPQMPPRDAHAPRGERGAATNERGVGDAVARVHCTRVSAPSSHLGTKEEAGR